MKKRLALTKDGRMTYCTATEENIGKGRCNHISHQENNESIKEFVERVSLKENEIDLECSVFKKGRKTMKKRLALTKDGRMTYCTATEENIGKGRCNHVLHQNKEETTQEFIDRAEKEEEKGKTKVERMSEFLDSSPKTPKIEIFTKETKKVFKDLGFDKSMENSRNYFIEYLNSESGDCIEIYATTGCFRAHNRRKPIELSSNIIEAIERQFSDFGIVADVRKYEGDTSGFFYSPGSFPSWNKRQK